MLTSEGVTALAFGEHHLFSSGGDGQIIAFEEEW